MGHVILEFSSTDDISEFMKTFLKSKNAKDCYVCMGYDGNNYFVELKNPGEG